jgi:LysR family glycine cleavage system transcriptional activator
MTRRMPPLNALRAFEVAARTGSLTRAAHELSLTQGAVSRSVAQLEDWIGLPLCIRTRRGIEVTPDGEAYATVLCGAFDQIEAHTSKLRERPADTTLRLKLPPTFAIRWLVPRLARFHALHRQADVQITTSHQSVEFDRDDVDVCIHSGAAPLLGAVCHRLFGEILLPVCSPRFVRNTRPLRRAADLDQHVLLCSLHRPLDWPTWLAAAKITHIDGNNGLKFENSALAYQAAVDELGIVMAQRAFVEDDLRTGRLVAPLPLRASTDHAYYLAYPRQRRIKPIVALFQRWILAQGAEMEEAT